MRTSPGNPLEAGTDSGTGGMWTRSQVRAPSPAVDLRTQPGGRVLIERWGGEAVLEGRVRRVEPAAFTKVSALGVEEQRVKMVIDIDSPPEQWRALGDGYRVGVRIVTLPVDNALKVPLGAVFPLPDEDVGTLPTI